MALENAAIWSELVTGDKDLGRICYSFISFNFQFFMHGRSINTYIYTALQLALSTKKRNTYPVYDLIQAESIDIEKEM